MSVIPIGRGKRKPTRAEVEKGAAPAEERVVAKQIVSVKSDIEAAIPRDRWDRPLIIQPDGGKPVAYRRASTVAEVLEDHYGLNLWHRRLTVEGLAQRPDLVQAAHTASKKELDEIVEAAIDQAGGNVASRNGTTMHRLTDLLDQGQDVPMGLPSNIIAMLEEYQKATERFEWLDSERFVVQDKIKVAGTYDRRAFDRKTGLRMIGDLKTGQNLEYLAVKTPAQVAVYASGDHYDLDGDREPHGADRDKGFLIHLPWVDDPREATCEIRSLDLRVGRKAILEAFRVERFRNIKADQTLVRF